MNALSFDKARECAEMIGFTAFRGLVLPSPLDDDLMA
jgi:hypothetical protein